jgi:hypothetical protein
MQLSSLQGDEKVDHPKTATCATSGFFRLLVRYHHLKNSIGSSLVGETPHRLCV